MGDVYPVKYLSPLPFAPTPVGILYLGDGKSSWLGMVRRPPPPGGGGGPGEDPRDTNLHYTV